MGRASSRTAWEWSSGGETEAATPQTVRWASNVAICTFALAAAGAALALVPDTGFLGAILAATGLILAGAGLAFGGAQARRTGLPAVAVMCSVAALGFALTLDLGLTGEAVASPARLASTEIAPARPAPVPFAATHDMGPARVRLVSAEVTRDLPERPDYYDEPCLVVVIEIENARADDLMYRTWRSRFTELVDGRDHVAPPQHLVIVHDDVVSTAARIGSGDTVRDMLVFDVAEMVGDLELHLDASHVGGEGMTGFAIPASAFSTRP